MAFKISWTDNAKENIKDITNYLLYDWNFEVLKSLRIILLSKH
jgi:plasmid stabilization system protein ParE